MIKCHVKNIEFERTLNWFVILEGAHPAYNTRDLIYRYVSDPQWVPVYQGTEYEVLAQVSPILLKLNKPQDWHIAWSTSFPGLAGSYLASDQGQDGIARHLQTLVSVNVEGGAESIFRFHDSWIMSALYSSLTDSEKDRVHGPINKWLWLLGNSIVESEYRKRTPAIEYPLEPGWLNLDRAKQEAIFNGLLAKRNWKEVQA
ncbi:DUF4123 domain-containing protein [Marinobacter sp. SS21]|uniref:DUF4123 domain-containing protein n=1 Tax=Marinobacter sp. SS21 TaxID=2979460 RepID=UPI00232C401C|nr:DUF4123 domain-containing protein [Marinobacter sp. SS21]MDC0664183.1 DUF4123 domain-containing protein [Marinobacter sp. SS21]